LRPFWVIVCATFAVGALFHLYAIATHVAPLWRHALFAAINLAVVWGCWRRPRWFVWVFAPLLLQQLYSHGGDLWQAYPESIDWSSLMVVVWMPIVALALWRSRHERG
jgi:hypothetical protein